MFRTSSTAPRAARCSATFAFALLLTPALAAAGLLDPLHTVGWRDEPLPLTSTLSIVNRLYYPALAVGEDATADPSAGPFPLVGFVRGATASPDFYDDFCTAIAAQGYVVASLGGTPPLQENFSKLATELRQLVEWVEQQSDDPGSPYAGMVWDGDVALVGHSMGGGVTQVAVNQVPRVRAAALLQPPSIAHAQALANLAEWDGRWMIVAGELDPINPPAEVQQVKQASTGGTRRLYVELPGVGHGGPLDPDVPGLANEPVPHATQLAYHQLLTVAFLDAELHDEDAYHRVFGDAAPPGAFLTESLSRAPALWAVEEPGSPAGVSVGLLGRADDTAWIAASLAPASIPTPLGELLVDPTQAVFLPPKLLGVDGRFELLREVTPGLAGLEFHVQALVHGATSAYTRADKLCLP